MDIQAFFNSKLADLLPQFGSPEKSIIYTDSRNILKWVPSNPIVEFVKKETNIKSLETATIDKLRFKAHESVISGLHSWYHNICGMVTAQFGSLPDDLSFIHQLYFAMRDDLEIRVIQDRSVSAIPTRNKVSVIIAARNNGKYLAECLHSCHNQTVRPREIIYSDDGSTDNSVSIATKFNREHGDVTVDVIQSKHKGVCAARNLGVSASSCDILIHVDGDDILPSNFIELHLEALTKNPNAPFVYGPAQCFGQENLFYSVPKWEERFIWDQNFCNTSSAIRREAFCEWRENSTKTYWDWDLFLRIARSSKFAPAPSQALLLYRQHDKNWSKTNGETKHADRKLEEKVRYDRVNLSICSVHSGRLPKLLPEWFNSLKNNSIAKAKNWEQDQKIELIILDNSHNQEYNNELHRQVDKCRLSFTSTRILRFNEFLENQHDDKHKAVSVLLAKAYTKLIDLAQGELIFFIEDDIILPESDSLSRLLKTACSSDNIKAIANSCVSGAYRNRHKQTTNPWIAGQILPNNRVEEFQELPKQQLTKIDLAGTGCLVAWKYFLPKIIKPFFRETVAAHDWWMLDNTLRNKILRTDVVCRHYQTDKVFV